VDYYRRELAGKAGITFEDDNWRRLVDYASLQRLLQALGAFSFLSLVKDKAEYRQYIRPALGFLERILEQQSGFSQLSQIVNKVVTSAII
jgi:aminoglycoside/choline kinase family phosphotransferase